MLPFCKYIMLIFLATIPFLEGKARVIKTNVRTGSIELNAVPLGEKEGGFHVYRQPSSNILVIDLKNIPGNRTPNIERRGSYIGVDASSFELFQGDVRFRPARWPKVGYDRAIAKGTGDDDVVLPPDLCARWGKEPFLWIGGYWKADWAYETSPVIARDDASRTLTVEALKAEGETRGGFPYYLFNAFGALTEPGEYVLDPVACKVYVIGFNGNRKFEVAVRKTLMDINGAKGLRLENLHFEKTLGTALRIRNSHNVTIDGCVIRHAGAGAITVEGGSNVTISNCTIEDTAEAAISVEGGDRKTLTAAGHSVVNSVIRNFGVDSRTYRPAIHLYGVGNRIENNDIAEGPHSAIILQGNDHIVRGNRIRNVVREADDAGAIYMGRNWTERGIVIEGNLFEEIGMQDRTDAALSLGRTFVSGIYLDDQESGFVVSRNVFDRVSRPVVIHGGRDNQIVDNAFLRCAHSGIWLGRRGEGLSGGTLEQELKAMPYKSQLWADRYPALASIAENSPADPINNREHGNVAIGCPLFSFRPDTSPDFWPSMGQASRVETAAAPDGSTLEVLGKVSQSCNEYPILCAR